MVIVGHQFVVVSDQILLLASMRLGKWRLGVSYRAGNGLATALPKIVPEDYSHPVRYTGGLLVAVRSYPYNQTAPA
ncbi:MAG: hypothetical protein ACRD6N_00110 [Pyrinomonadaceae bacterium]